MKVILFVLFSFFFYSQVSGQKKLKYDITSRGDTSFHTSQERLYVKSGAPKSVSEQLSVTGYRTNGSYMLMFFIQTGRTSVFSIGQGSLAELKFDDGTSLTLSSISGSESRTSSMAYGSFMYVSYRIGTNALQQLKGSKISSIKINTSNGYMNYELKPKMASVISDVLLRLDE